MPELCGRNSFRSCNGLTCVDLCFGVPLMTIAGAMTEAVAPLSFQGSSTIEHGFTALSRVKHLSNMAYAQLRTIFKSEVG